MLSIRRWPNTMALRSFRPASGLRRTTQCRRQCGEYSPGSRSLRNEQFFSLGELNRAIRQKLEDFSHRPFQKKEGSRYEIFRDEEQPLLAPLPAAPYELAEWKQATVQFNYHISFAGMLYSVPYEYIKRKVDVRVNSIKLLRFFTITTGLRPIAVFMDVKGNTVRLQSICRSPTNSIWNGNGDRFRKWAERIGSSTCQVVDAILTSKRVDSSPTAAVWGLFETWPTNNSVDRFGSPACRKALSFTGYSQL